MITVDQALIGLLTVEGLCRISFRYLLTFCVSDRFSLRSWIGTMCFFVGITILLWPQILQCWCWNRVCRKILELVVWCLPWLTLRLLWIPGHYLVCRLLQYMWPSHRCAVRSIEIWFQLLLGVGILVYAIRKAWTAVPSS